MTLVRSIATVGGYTMASRVTGFVRDILIARVLGTGEMADAFFVAQRLPNLFRSLFAEGAFNAAFVPQFARRLADGGPAAAKVFAEQALSVLLTALMIFTLAAQIAMPWLMHVIAPGFTGRPAKFAMAVQFTQVTFPYLLFISLTALQGGVLNSLNRFAHAAAAPIMLNVTMILALVFVAPATGLTGLALSWAMAIAGIIQFLWMVIACHRAGMALRLPWPRLTPGVKRLLQLMLPGIIGSSVMQVNLLIGTMIATHQPAAVSYLYYADRIYQLPLAVVGSAVGVVLLPELARSLRAKGEAAAMQTQNRCIEYALLLTLPATVALLAIPDPIVSVLYERGAFDAAAGIATSWALVAYSIGLPAYVLAKALTPGFFAREDTATPFRFAMISLAFNIVLSVALFRVLNYAGIALATALASWLNVGLLSWGLHRRGQLKIDAQLARNVPKALACSLLMGLVLRGGAWLLEGPLAGHLLAKTAALSLLVGGGVALFFGLATMTGTVAAAELKRWLKRA
ncbi:MAG: putative peptidoglycan lipid flippase [Rhodospirillaceae bacterium]|jgi:putative peptidoglycan lipid II flippase|nr:putative peptidoglycan lipid flippase [Rhodospirillaceae bacterium]